MYKMISAVLIAVFSLIPGPVPAMELEGPLQVRNQFAPFLPINQPYLERAAAGSSFSVGLSHSSVFMMRDSVLWGAHLDMELTELSLRYRKNIPDLMEVGIELPVLRATGGFMDRPLAWYHRAFGFPDYGRSTRPRNEFLYEVTRNGAPVVQGDNDRSGPGDARITFKRTIMKTDPVVSLM
ncbi:MAG TPA: DUF3187 family protein, partial [Nitrospirota bacterium]